MGDLDFIVLSLRREESRWIDWSTIAFLRRCKPQVVLVNMTRGDLVDQAAEVVALSAGRVGETALYVFTTKPL